jgi:hypothetical protein
MIFFMAFSKVVGKPRTRYRPAPTTAMPMRQPGLTRPYADRAVISPPCPHDPAKQDNSYTLRCRALTQMSQFRRLMTQPTAESELLWKR